MNDTPQLVGKTVIAGLCYFDEGGQLISQQQIHGVVEAANADAIVMRLNDGSEFHLPPAPEWLQPAPPGEFRESSSGITVSNPDFMTMWNFRRLSSDPDEKRWHATPVRVAAPPIQPTT